MPRQNLVLSPSLAPVGQLFLEAPASEIHTFILGAHDLLRRAPELVDRVRADLDAHGLAKKSLRWSDAAFRFSETPRLPGVCDETGVRKDKPSALSQGRPRTPAEVVTIFLLLRGLLGEGFKGWTTATFLRESITLRVAFANYGMHMPCPSTLTELVNAVSNETRCRILDAQIRQAKVEGLDDFKTMFQDSTAVDANTVWPTDSGIIVALIERIVRVGGQMNKWKVSPICPRKLAAHLKELSHLDRDIDLAGGKNRTKIRAAAYEKMLRKGHQARRIVEREVRKVRAAINANKLAPRLRAAAEVAANQLQSDARMLAQILANCHTRIVEGRRVASADKIASISDRDAAFIVKGQRDPVVGYKPQLARSGGGFVTALLVSVGNACDSSQLIAMLEAVMARTGVLPNVVSADDGYASKANVEKVRLAGVTVVSISGSKGRKLTDAFAWCSDSHVKARKDRSAIESLMFTLKDGFDFGRAGRRGIDSVTGELLEKILAYNLCLIQRKRAEQKDRAKSAIPPPVADAA